MGLKHVSLILLSGLWVVAPLSCASKGGVGPSDKSESGAQNRSKKKPKKSSKDDGGGNDGPEEPKSGAPAPAPAAPAKKDMTTGKLARVTMAFGGEGALDATIPQQILGEVLPALDGLARKEPENIPLAVTHMGIQRMAGQADDIALFQRRSSSGGSQDPWFLIEAGYGAVRRRNYAFAEYLFAKAEKNAKDPYVKAAAVNGFGLRYWMDGKMPVAAKEVQRAIAISDSYGPAVLSMAFLSLRAGDYGGAEQHFRKAASLFPQSANARLGLAAALRLQGKAGDAADVLRPLSKNRPNDKRIAWNLALALSEDPSRKAEAQQLLKQYFSMAGVFPELDARANALQNRLNQPPPAPPKPAQEPPSGAGGGAPATPPAPPGAAGGAPGAK